MRGDISALNEAIVSENSEKIQEALERLKNSSMEIGKAIYSQSDSQGDQQPSEEEQKQEEEKKEEPASEEAEKKEDEVDKKEKEEKK